MLGHYTTPPRSLVTPEGFEPSISTLRGWRPRPLDDGANQLYCGPVSLARNAWEYSIAPRKMQISSELVELDEHGAFRDEHGGGYVEAPYHPGVRSADGVLHLHRLEDE
jgi:hypothetical protein